jgi:cytochrome P450
VNTLGDVRAVFELEPEAIRCPYPFYDAIRDDQGLVFIPEIDCWLVTRFDDIVHVARHPEIFSSLVPTGPVLARQQAEALMALAADEPDLIAQLVALRGSVRVLLNADPPDHLRQRKLVNRAFTPPKVAALEPRMREIANGLVDAFAPRGSAELVSEYGVLLPLTVIAESLGVPDDDLALFKRWSDAFVAAIGNHHLSKDQLRTILVSQNEFFTYFSDKIEDRRAAPRDDLISDVVHANVDGEPLTDHEMLSMFNQFLVAGNETTTKLIASAVKILLERPALQDELRADPAAIGPFIEEVLRLEPPVQGLYRSATVDTEVGGTPISAGSHLLLVYAAGNRDGERFECPSELRPGRPQAMTHLAFGHGEHFCLGSALARAEGRIGIEVLLHRLRDIRPAPGVDLADLAYEPSYVLHGLQELRVQFSSSAS